MSEEEIISCAQSYKELQESLPEESRNWLDKIVIGLLDLYQKEKEKNKELIDGQIETIKTIVFPEFLKDFILKDKIREKIEELEKEIEIEGLTEKDNDLIYTPYGLYKYAQNNLKELLEEE